MKIKKGWRFKNREIKYLKEVLNSDFSALSNGSMNERLEKKFSQIHNQKYAITANSGTSTLHMSLDALGVGHGDEVIIPSLTVAMCGFAVWQCGATPVFTDVDSDTFLIDPYDIEKKISNKTKAIMVVHLYGLVCNMNKILQLAKKYKIKVIEDCAQCFLGKDSKKRISGTIGSVGSWSFENSKHISTGEGGIVTTNDKKLATKMRKFGGVGFKNLTASSGKVRIDRSKFQNPNWFRHDTLAYNYRLSEICAAVGLAQTEKLKYFVKKRIESGKSYYKSLNAMKSKLLIPQIVPKGFTHCYYTFAAKFEGEKYGISWKSFREKYVSFGGDGIYAAWKNVNDETIFKNIKNKGLVSGSMKLTSSYGYGLTPVAKKLQRKIMQFTTNQKNKAEIKKQINALEKTIIFFEKNNKIN